MFRSIKKLFLGVIFFFIIAVIFIFVSNMADFSSKHSITSNKKIKHDDEYYYSLVDSYSDKIEEASVKNVINSYKNLGIVKSTGYINFRSEPNENNTRSIIGLMNNGDALDILEWDVKNSDIYCKVKSGGMTGYVAKQFVETGENAINRAKEKPGLVILDLDLPGIDGFSLCKKLKSDSMRNIN